METAEKILQAPASDEYDAYGVTVASKLRRMEVSQRIYCENLINKAMYLSTLNKLTETLDIVAPSSGIPTFPPPFSQPVSTISQMPNSFSSHIATSTTSEASNSFIPLPHSLAGTTFTINSLLSLSAESSGNSSYSEL